MCNIRKTKNSSLDGWRWIWTHLQDIQLSFDNDHIEQKSFDESFNLIQNLLPKFASPSISKFSLDVSQITSLVVLNLKPWFFRQENHNLFRLPNLKKLSVELNCHWNSRVLENLVSSTPSLEDLSFTILYEGRIPDYEHHTVNLSCPRLKRLNMCLDNSIHAAIDAPNLEYLTVNDYGVGDIFPHRVSFLTSPIELLAYKFFAYTDYLEESFQPCNLFSVIPGIIFLTTVAQVTSPLIAPLTFTRLTHLKLVVIFEFVGLDLLQQCPVLEVLSIDMTQGLHSSESRWSLPDSPPQCIVTCVKRIEILVNSLYENEEIVLQVLKYLLGTAKFLELITINIARPDLDEYEGMDPKLHFINQLLDTPKSSPQCRIEIYDPHRRVLGGGISYQTSP